jgi:hypothetical protein
MTAPREEYTGRIARWNEIIARGERRHLRISNLRLVVFAGAGVVAWLALSRGAIAPAWLLLPAGAFLLLLVAHARVLNANDRALRARQYFDRGIARLDGTWAGQGEDGGRFLAGHAYARDLDLFGRGSLFQLLNTARTEAGEETLADWLREPADVGEVRERQQAVAELRGRLDFRETLSVLAAEAHVSRTGSLSRWAAAEPVGFGALEARLFAVCAVVSAVLVGASASGLVPGVVAIGWLVVPAAIALWQKNRVWRVLRRVDSAAHDLSLLAELLDVLEQTRFESPRLASLHGTLGGDTRPSQLIGRLRRLIAARDALRNELVRPFGLLLLVRSQAAVAIDRWHQVNRVQLARWLTTIGEFEAFSSLATHAYEHPADPFPELTHDGPVLDATALAHPLIPETVAVRNDVALGGTAPHLLIVSGSNMSGKSTLMRSVGANAVLALAGGTVRAARLLISPLAIGATIKVEDSLQEGHSRFYSEILRIRDVVERTRGSLPVLFLLDEILHGTNSHDRRIGADAIVRALVDAGAIGIVTTHDLALTSLAATLGARARNVHFEDRIENGRMTFDYRMRDGVVERSNALELMRAVGLEV